MKPIYLLGIILLISIFFRTYDIVGRYGYAHDAELFSWIVKDIVVNDHPRLIGQLTSAPGIFIGPLFYYLLVPFFLLFKMDSVAAVVPVTIIGILTTLSYYLVFSKLFNKTTGLFAAFLQAILLTWIGFDRRIVPSTPTNIWVIWYFFTLIQIARGNFWVLPILGLLIGLIWNIHIALLPTLFAIPFAFLASRKLPKVKEFLQFGAALTVSSLPLIIFELKHGLIQTNSLMANFGASHGGGAGIEKFSYIMNMISKNINNMFISPYSLPDLLKPVFVLSFIIPAIILIRKKVFTKKELFPIGGLFLGVIGFFTLSSSLVSEYYLYSIEIVFVLILSLFFTLTVKNKAARVIIFLILSILFTKNVYHFVTDYIYKKDYVERKAVVEFITNDAKEKGFPCIGISYITTIGENTGFRYFFYLKNQHLIRPSLDVPVYNIVIPDELSINEVTKKFGHIGIIPPVKIPSKEVINRSCQGENTNLTDPLFGYVD